MNILGNIIASIGLLIGSWFGYHPETPTVNTPITLGDFNPTGGQTYRLQSSIGGSSTSVTLQSFKEPTSGIKYTMSYLNSTIEYATIEPQSSNKEFVSFTGITQNADGSATLTGLSRGLGFSYPFTASTTLQQAHSAQSIFILSNPPQLYNQYANKSNADTITGNWTFTGQTTFSNFPISPLQSTSSVNVAGVSQLATPAQTAASTATSTNGTNAPLVIANSTATSTFNSATSGNVVVVTNASGKVDTHFTFPNTTASSSVLMSDGSTPTNVTWNGVPHLINASSSPINFSAATASTTLMSATIPANALGGGNILDAVFRGMSFCSPASNNVWLEYSYGAAATTTIAFGPLSTGGGVCALSMDLYIQANGTNAQRTSFSAASTTASVYATSTTAINSTVAQPLLIIVKTDGASGNNFKTFTNYLEMLPY